MAFNGFVNIFNNSPIQPSDVSYLSIVVSGTGQTTTLEWAFQNPASLTPFCQFIQVTGTATAASTIVLPDALYSSTLQSTIIYNQSNEDIIVQNNALTEIGTIVPNAAYFIGNTDNTTSAGNWSVFINLGAGSSTVTAAALIDPTSNTATPPESNSGGLGAFNNYLKVNYKIYDYAGTSYDGNPSDRGTVVTWNADAGNYFLPDSATSGDGFISGLQNRSSNGGVINVYTIGIDTLNGQADFDTGLPAVIQLQVGESTFFVTDGSGNWYTFCFSSNVQYAIQSINYNLATDTSGGTITVTAIDASYQIQIFTGTYGTSPYPTVDVIYPANLVQQYFITNQSTTNNLFVYVANETDTNFQYTVIPGQSITTFTDGTHLYLSPNVISNEKVILPDGSVGAPSLTFVNDTTSGLFRNPTGSLPTMTQAGTAVAQFAATAFTSLQQVQVPTNAISYSFTGQTTSGMSYVTANSSVNVTVGGVLAMSYLNNIINPALMINSPTQSYQQATINIYSLSRAYQNG